MRATRRTALGFLSAGLLAAGHEPFDWWALGPIAGVPWLLAVRGGSGADALATSVLTGTLFACCVSSWVPSALRGLESPALHSAAGAVAIGFWGKAPLFALIGWVAWRVRNLPPWLQIPSASLAAALGEFAIANSELGIPCAFFGHSQSRALGVAQLAVVGGVPAISAVLIGSQMGVVASIEQHRLVPVCAGMIAGWLALVIAGFPLARILRDETNPPSTNELRFLLIQPNLPRAQRWDPEKQALALESTARQVDRARTESPSLHPDLIVWPENLVTTAVDGSGGFQREIESLVRTWQTPLVTGVVRSPLARVPNTYRSSILWFDPRRGVVAALDKERAVPLLESSRNPASIRWVREAIGRAATWPKVEESTTHSSFRGAFSLAAVLCYEVLFPGIVASRREFDSVAILNLADDSWVDADEATRQLVEYARFRAIEQRLPLIRVAHGGLSVVIDEFGETVAALPMKVATSRVVSVRPSAPASAVERVSIAALPLATGLVVGWLWRRLSSPTSP